jgi:hypothetical protein
VALARQFGFEEWAQPAGGCCFLTDAQYSSKLADLWHARGRRDYSLDDIVLLKIGRHIRPAPHFKLIVGREEGENNFLEGYRKSFVHLRMVSHLGPLTLIDGAPESADIALAASIAARYGQGRDAERVTFAVERPDGTGEVLTVTPARPDEIPLAWHV